MLRTVLFLIGYFIIISIHSQIETSFESNFHYYKITEYEPGMKFMVNPKIYGSGLSDLRRYNKRFSNRTVNLKDFEGEIFEFVKYEIRKRPKKYRCEEDSCTVLVLVLKHNGKLYEYGNFYSKEEFEEHEEELKKNTELSLHKNLEDFLFYDDVEKARDLLIGKRFYIKKSLNFFSKNKLYEVSNITAHSEDYPAKIEFIEVESGKKYTQRVRLSGTNMRFTCEKPEVSKFLGIYSFSDYFVHESKYASFKEREKHFIKPRFQTELFLEPNRNSKIISKINKRERVKYIGYNNGFLKLEKDSLIGYAEKINFTLLKGFASPYILKSIDSFKKIERKKSQNEVVTNCHYTTNEVDEFTSNKRMTTKPYNLINKELNFGEIGIKLIKNGPRKYLRFLSSYDLGCTSSYENNPSSVRIKLENDDIITFSHVGDTDCGTFNQLSYLSESDILRLNSSPIKIIRLEGTDSYHDVKTIPWKTFFQDKLKCID